MNRYLLDTHTAMWYFNGDKTLSKTAGEIILELSNQIHLSIISAWEIAIKHSIGKLDIDGNTADFINDADFKVSPTDEGPFIKHRNMMVILDQFSAQYLSAKMLSTKQSPTEIISSMIRRELGLSNSPDHAPAPVTTT